MYYSCRTVKEITYFILYILVEARMNRAIDDVRAVESEKLEAALLAEKLKIEQLEANIEQLQIVSFSHSAVYIIWKLCLKL